MSNGPSILVGEFIYAFAFTQRILDSYAVPNLQTTWMVLLHYIPKDFEILIFGEEIVLCIFSTTVSFP